MNADALPTDPQNSENLSLLARLDRMEQKIEAILEKLQWAQESNAGWYAEIHAKDKPDRDTELPLFKK